MAKKKILVALVIVGFIVIVVSLGKRCGGRGSTGGDGETMVITT